MKYKDIKDKAEIINNFLKLPKTIIHSKFDGSSWSKEEYRWTLELSAPYYKTTHINNSGGYRLAYVLEGYEGEEQALPYEKEELDEMIETGIILFSGGLYGDNIGDLVERMTRWLNSEYII